MAIDYRSFGLGKRKDDLINEGAFQKHWWLSDKKEMAPNLIKVVNWIAQNDSKRQMQYQVSARLYGNITLMGINGLTSSKAQANQSGIRDRVTYNVVQSCIDTITAKIAKNKPRPMFLTNGGDYKIQRKAKKLDKFCEGIFYENDAHRMGVDAFRDAAVWGDGIIHVYEENGRVKWERVIPSELYCDLVDGFYGEPRQMHRVKNVDREILMEMFPEKAQEIADCPAARVELSGNYQVTSDQIAVVESWHLPSGPEANDGMHCICIENTDLLCEDYKRNYFPFAKLSWTPRLYGFWSQGIPEQIQSIQLEINKIAWVIQRTLHLGGTFKVWFKNGSKVVKEHINNDIGLIINSEEMPQYLVPPLVQPEVYNRLQQLKMDAFEQVGVSMLSAAAQKPMGLNSGKALREFNDIESDRFMIIGQEYEDFFLQLAKLSIDAAKDLFEKEKKYQVKVPGKKFVETIDWKNINLEEDEYVMQIFPVSSLPNEPAGRLQTIQEYMQAGLIDPRAGRRLLDFPDLEQIESLNNAQEEWIHDCLEKIIEDGDYNPPDPSMDLQLAKQLYLQYYAYGQTQNLEADKLDLLRRWNTQIDLLIQKATPPAPSPEMMPQANPQAAPTSDMIPNVPGVQ